LFCTLAVVFIALKLKYPRTKAMCALDTSMCQHNHLLMLLQKISGTRMYSNFLLLDVTNIFREQPDPTIKLIANF
jgi:hypothetical protein